MSFLTTCLEPDCPELVLSGRCPTHATEYLRARNRRREQTGDTHSHGRVAGRRRRAALRRDPICRLCGGEVSTEADHVVPIADGGEDVVENMQGLCHGCHREKTNAERAARGGR